MSRFQFTIASFGVRGYVPLIISIFLSALMLLPIGTGVSNVMMPHFAMMCVFYWSASRPLMMPYGACALIGFILDLWLDVPMGLNLMLLVLARLFVLSQIKYFKGRSRLVYWGVFSMMATGLFVISWVVISVLSGHMVAVQPVLQQLLLTIFSYAVIGFILGRIRRSVLS